MHAPTTSEAEYQRCCQEPATGHEKAAARPKQSRSRSRELRLRLRWRLRLRVRTWRPTARMFTPEHTTARWKLDALCQRLAHRFFIFYTFIFHWVWNCNWKLNSACVAGSKACPWSCTTRRSHEEVMFWILDVKCLLWCQSGTVDKTLRLWGKGGKKALL